MTLKGLMAFILHNFTGFVSDVIVKQLLGLPRFQNLLLVVYDHINAIILAKHEEGMASTSDCGCLRPCILMSFL